MSISAFPISLSTNWTATLFKSTLFPSDTRLKLDGSSRLVYVFQLRQLPLKFFQNMDLSADSKSRIAIVGENGAGKSTLLKLLLSRIEPSSGYVKMHRNLRVSYFAQHHIEDFDLNLTPIETLQKRKPGMTSEEYRYAKPVQKPVTDTIIKNLDVFWVGSAV